MKKFNFFCLILTLIIFGVVNYAPGKESKKEEKASHAAPKNSPPPTVKMPSPSSGTHSVPAVNHNVGNVKTFSPPAVSHSTSGSLPKDNDKKIKEKERATAQQEKKQEEKSKEKARSEADQEKKSSANKKTSSNSSGKQLTNPPSSAKGTSAKDTTGSGKTSSASSGMVFNNPESAKRYNEAVKQATSKEKKTSTKTNKKEVASKSGPANTKKSSDSSEKKSAKTTTKTKKISEKNTTGSVKTSSASNEKQVSNIPVSWGKANPSTSYQCTDYVHAVRPDLNNVRGNAAVWLDKAKQSGLKTASGPTAKPVPGAVVVMQSSDKNGLLGEYGHVGVVKETGTDTKGGPYLIMESANFNTVNGIKPNAHQGTPPTQSKLYLTNQNIKGYIY